MKKYIIIILSFLGLLFINVGIVSAAGKLSSKLTGTQVQEINNRIKEAGLPLVIRDDIKYKGWTDYVIYMSEGNLANRKRATLVLYTRPSNDKDGWQIKNGTTGMKLYRNVTGYYYYTLVNDNNKWYWEALDESPILYDKVNLQSFVGYIFYSTQPITETIDNEFIFFSTKVTSAEVSFGVSVEDVGSDQDGGILGMLGNIVKGIIGFPGKMVELISNFFKGIFMPDEEMLKSMVDDTKRHIEYKFDFLGESSEVKDIFQSSKSIKDVESTYGNRVINCLVCEPDVSTPYLGEFNFKVIDSEILNRGLNRFRPVIRGFLTLMLLFYNFNQFFGFIGQRSSVTSGKEGA